VSVCLEKFQVMTPDPVSSGISDVLYVSYFASQSKEIKFGD